MRMRTIIFLLSAIRMFTALMYFPEMARKILYCDSIKTPCSRNPSIGYTIWKSGKNKFI